MQNVGRHMMSTQQRANSWCILHSLRQGMALSLSNPLEVATHMDIYDSSQSQVTFNDDGGSGNNFKIKYTLTAGTTYCVAVKFYNLSTTGTFKCNAVNHTVRGVKMDVCFNSKTMSTKNAMDSNKKRCVKKEKFANLLITFSSNEKVNDEIRGVLVYSGSNWFFISVSQYTALRSSKPLKRIGVLLESPHKDEYQNGLPIRPANGVTGQKIEALIAQRIKTIWQSDKLIDWQIAQFDYEVVLINAIQYQTSCYKLLGAQWDKRNRDHVFKLMFNNFNLDTDLEQRLKAFNLDLLVNCVTNKLKKEVRTTISLINCTRIDDEHPSAWK